MGTIAKTTIKSNKRIIVIYQKEKEREIVKNPRRRFTGFAPHTTYEYVYFF